MADTVYQLSDVVKRYRKGRGEVLALRGVNLVICDGEWLAIQGPTGHGKSTLLQILGGLDRPTSGTVEFDGVDLARLPETRVTRERARSIGFVFQTFNLIPTLSAAENVEVALVPLGFPAAERRMRAEEGLSAVGLGDRLRHLPSELSGGQQQRVAIAGQGAPGAARRRADRQPGRGHERRDHRPARGPVAPPRPDHGAGHPRQRRGRPGAAPRPDEERSVRAALMRFRVPARMRSRPDAT
jgi:predicted ABC-type transport system involved in lysophospholipase L1 biosynthesis ATPase subunit